MVKQFDDSKVGAVGAKSLYPDGTIQHAGVMLEEKRLAVHALRTWKDDARVNLNKPCEWNAVTGAFLMTRRNLLEKVGEFDEDNFPIAYNDIDYCLKLRDLGCRILCVNDARLYHYESASRKSDTLAQIFNRKRYRQFLTEQDCMRKKWKKEIEHDPYYNCEFV